MAEKRKQKSSGPKGRPTGGIIAGLVVLLLAGGIWWLSQNIAGISRGPAETPNVNLLPPPPPAPPPPPPKPETPPPPDKAIEPPKPADQPKADEPRQLTIAGPAQAGGDSFGIKAGSGGGSSVIGGPSEGGGGTGGGGFAEASYTRYLGTELQRAVQSDSHLNSHVFTAEVAVWIDAAGRLTHARIYRTSGDTQIDEKLVASLEAMRPLSDPPPPSLRFPQHIAVRSRHA